MKRIIIAIALGSIAACGGETSDREGRSGLTVEWTDSDLETNASRIGYGSDPPAILKRDTGGPLVFTPQTAQDHIATPFTELSAYDGMRSLELVLDVQSPGGEACVAHLQDQAFNVLTKVP